MPDGSSHHVHSRRAPTTGERRPHATGATGAPMFFASNPLTLRSKPACQEYLNLLVARLAGGVVLIRSRKKGWVRTPNSWSTTPSLSTRTRLARTAPRTAGADRPSVVVGRPGALLRALAPSLFPYPVPMPTPPPLLTVSSPRAARFASNEENPAAGGHMTPCLLRASRSSSASTESR